MVCKYLCSMLLLLCACFAYATAALASRCLYRKPHITAYKPHIYIYILNIKLVPLLMESHPNVLTLGGIAC